MTNRHRHQSQSPNLTSPRKSAWLVAHLRTAGTRMMLATALGMSTASVGLAQGADIQPQDGQWLSIISVEYVNGCSPDMQAEVEAETGSDHGSARQVRFSNPLQASDLNELVDTEMNWERVGTNRWVGRLREAESTFMGRVESRVDTVLLVNSARNIEQNVQLHISLPPVIARQIGSEELCQMELKIRHDRLGD